jgi:hypothetical protein
VTGPPPHDPHTEAADVDEPLLDEVQLDRALADGDDELGVQLRALLDPGAAVRDRTKADVDRALRSTNTMDALLDLAGVGWWTLRALLTDDRGPADGDGGR